VLWERRDDKDGVRCVPVFAPGGTELLLGEGKEIARVDARTGREVGRLPVPGGEGGPVLRVAVSPDGRWVAACTYSNIGEGGWLVLLDRATGRARWRQGFPRQQNVCAVAFASSGRRLLTAHADGRLRFWETITGKLALERAGPPGSVIGLQVSRDSRLAVTDARGAVALVWSLQP
jgi:WD40 repeat protein